LTPSGGSDPGAPRLSSRPLVTVLTPCYNHEPFLDDYFGGLLAQTYDNVELILFDDGSTDGSWNKVQAHVPSLETKFTSVVAERHENIGAPQELQLAIERATGELLCILESDDYYLPTKLEENVRFLNQHPDVGAVHSDTDYLYSAGIERLHWRNTRPSIPTGDVFEELLIDNFVMTCALCCRTNLYRQHVDQADYARRGYLAGDWAFCLDLARHTQFGYLDKSLARYRVRPGSYSHPRSPGAHYAFHRSVVRMRLDYATDGSVSSSVARRVSRDYYRYIYRQGLALGRPEDHLEGWRWLRDHYPECYGGVRHRLAARLVSIRAIWWLAGRIGILKLGWMAWRAVARMRAKATQGYD
jgi:alpha-1,3-rhamnosyltransferase